MNKSSSVLLDGRSDCLGCVNTLIDRAQQRVYIVGQNLEADLYNHKSIYDHLTKMATENRKTDIRLISHDTRLATTNGHYLILLTQKLLTFAHIRTTVDPAHRKFRENWLIVDDMAFMRLKNPLRYEGYFENNNKLECRSLTAEFLDIWEASQLDQNTRRLSL
jgi:hypothetical protein